MSRVYLAEDQRTDQPVAIKVLDIINVQDKHLIEQFAREYRLLSDITNAHVVQLFDQLFTEQHACIVMEYFPQGDLTVRIRQGVAPQQALDYLQQIAHGLASIHEKGVVHRDLKPNNILFRQDQSLGIVDFGLAQIDSESQSLIRQGEVYGTPAYVSPEQARGDQVDSRSDIYSLGIIFYQMLTDKKPYRASHPRTMFYKHIYAQLPKLPGPYAHYQTLLDQMLAKSVHERLKNAQTLLDMIDKYQTI